MQRSVTSVVVLIVRDVSSGLDVGHRRGERLALLHERVVPVPGPGFGAGTVVLGLHKIRPGIVFNL